jgi:hypothetical protein
MAASPGFLTRRIGGQHEEPGFDVLPVGPEAVGLNPKQRKAANFQSRQIAITGSNMV